MSAHEIHNRLSAEIMRRMAEPIIEHDLDEKAVLVLLESVIAGTILLVAKPGGEEIVLAEVAKNARRRIRDLLLAGRRPEGSA